MKGLKFKKYYDLALLIGTPVAFFLIAVSEGAFYWVAGIMFVAIFGQYLLNRTLEK